MRSPAKITVIVLGDARTDNLDPRADILRTISERSKRLVWLNPEGRMASGWGDSEMPRYCQDVKIMPPHADSGEPNIAPRQGIGRTSHLLGRELVISLA